MHIFPSPVQKPVVEPHPSPHAPSGGREREAGAQDQVQPSRSGERVLPPLVVQPGLLDAPLGRGEGVEVGEGVEAEHVHPPGLDVVARDVAPLARGEDGFEDRVRGYLARHVQVDRDS